MERIAPLAKILAEANGIEWEHLHGTGPGGQIVEQDILDYLTRVMSGEAEPPSTPVDAPPPDWDGNDVPGAGMFDAAALSKAGVESDIAEFVSQGRPAGPQIPGTAAPALETSDFELDDQEPAPTPAPVQPAAPAPAVENPSGSMISAPAAPAAVTAGGLGSLLSRLYHKDTPAPTTPAPTTPAPAAPVTATTPSVPTAVQEVTAPAAEPVRVEPVRVEAARPVVETSVVTAATAEAVIEPVPAKAPEAPVVATPVVEAAPEPAAPARMPEPQPEPVVEPAPVVVPTPAPAAPAAPAFAASAPAPSAPVYSGPTSEVPRDAVWFGTYLRRNANVGNLNDLRGQLSEALERDVPLALLVARAAQRHLDALGLANVAMQDINAGKALSVGAGQQSGIRDAVTATLSDYDGTPDLLIVDAGQIGLDDLHYPHTLTLSVGRVDDGQASLSLQGDVEPAKAAQFLAKVADTLEKPVILLV